MLGVYRDDPNPAWLSCTHHCIDSREASFLRARLPVARSYLLWPSFTFKIKALQGIYRDLGTHAGSLVSSLVFQEQLLRKH